MTAGNAADAISEDDLNTTPVPALERRRRGGISGMVLAELRELAGTLGVTDTTGMRRGDLIAEIKERQQGSPGDMPSPAAGDGDNRATRRRAARRRDTPLEDAEHDYKQHEELDDELRAEEEQAEEDLHVRDRDDAEIDEVWVEEPAFEESLAPPPPPARLLTRAALLIRPVERENWLAEMRTARWELRADPRARRRQTWSHARLLLPAAVTSWRHGGGPTAPREVP